MPCEPSIQAQQRESGDEASLAGKTVLMVTTNADLAGAPMHVRDLVRGMRAHGGRVVVIFGEDGPIRRELEAEGVETHIVSTLRSNLNVLQDVQSFAKVLRLGRATRPDLVHAHSSKAGLVARLAGRTLGVPVVYTVHGWGFGPGRRKTVSRILRLLEASLTRWTSHYIAVSNTDHQVGRQHLAIAPSAITTVHNGVADCESRALPELSRTVVMVARNAHPKDYRTLFEAADALDCDLWCVGAGTDSEEFKQLARSVAPNRHDRFQYFGARTDIPQLLSHCGVFVLSSNFEGLPLSIIEAMRAGLPVVASNVGGVGELVDHGVTGALFQAGNVSALRRELERLLSDPTLRRTMGAQSRRRYGQEFRSETMIARTVNIYKNVLSAS